MSIVTSLLRPKRLVLAAGVGGAVSFGLAYRFALQYRARVGLPHRSSVEGTPADFGLAFEAVEIPSVGANLAGWFVPAEGSGKGNRGKADRQRPFAAPRPGIAIVHGWESNRGRSLAHVRYLHAAGFHCLVIDARGHGDNQPETLPVNVPEFGEDAAAAARWLAARPEVSAVGLLGHSMGGSGVILGGAAEPAVGAVVALSTPADLVRMTAQTFEMASFNIPGPIATPLAYLTAMVLLIPRHHNIDEASAAIAAAKYRGPLLLMHGQDDRGVPVAHMALIAEAAQSTRAAADSAPVETLVIPGYGHRWLFEEAEMRRRTAAFFARELVGPMAPAKAGELAAACVVERPANPVYGFGASGGGVAAEAEARENARRETRELSGTATDD
jgi:alpha-beta hydrolase superfamily lysophospholipase